jgi:hypothetical protein
MANAVKARETIQVIRENPSRLDMVKAVIAGDWAYCETCDGNEGEGCENCHYRGVIRPSEQAS